MKNQKILLESLEKAGLGPFTVDDFLGGKVRLIQLEKGYRAGMDGVLLAAAVTAKAGERCLDIGAASGVIGLCLGHRVAGVLVDGLEIQDDLVELAKANIALNQLEDSVSVTAGSILKPLKEIPENSYDHVIANPPYFEGKASRHSPRKTKDLAHTGEGEAGLEDWVKFALSKVKNKGTLSFIFRAERLDDLLVLLHRRAGEVIILPLRPHEGEAAKTVIVQARKGLHGGTTLAPGMVLHGETERYSKAAEDVLRRGEPIDLSQYHRAKGP